MFKLFVFTLFSILSSSLWATEGETEMPTDTAVLKKPSAQSLKLAPDMLVMAQQEINFDEQQRLLKQQKLTTHINFCAPCHGKLGLSSVAIYPNHAAQHQDYLFKQLLAFKYRRRKDPIMEDMVTRLNEEDMLELARYYASLSNGIAQINSTGEANESSN